jgi:methylmalonyl-CoA mutase
MGGNTSAPGSTPRSTSTPLRRASRFFWAQGKNYFMEVAKMRAARLLWAKIVKEFNPKNPKSLALRTHSQTSGWSLTEQDPFNNVTRTCIEAMAAALGHTQSLHTNALDEAIALPTDFSARIARNTQLFLQDETGICKIIDPWGGSYYVEALTDALIKRGWEHLCEVEELGGMAKAIESGLPKMRIEEAAARRQARIDSGTGNHRRGQQIPAGERRSARDPRRRQHRRPRIPAQAPEKLKSERDSAKCNVGPQCHTRPPNPEKATCLGLAIEAAQARASLGEISDAMEKVFGRHKAVIRSITGVYSSEYGKSEDDRRRSVRPWRTAFAETRRPPSAYHDRQDGPGRTRPRCQGGGHRLCRHGL